MATDVGTKAVSWASAKLVMSALTTGSEDVASATSIPVTVAGTVARNLPFARYSTLPRMSATA